MHYISKNRFDQFLVALKADYRVVVPVKQGAHRFYQRFEQPHDDIVVGEVRAFEPLKAFFLRARQTVAVDFKKDVPHADDQPLAIVGVKACDLKGFKVQDFVFANQELPDPFYVKNREENLIISADCTCAIPTCFCLALGIKPHPEGDFDLNLSTVQGGFVVQVGSSKGKEVLGKYSDYFDPAPREALVQKDQQRQKVIAEVEANIKENSIPIQKEFKEIIRSNYESPLWQEESKTCVECGACNTICPTCHCFFLVDQSDGKHLVRSRLWDSCMIKDFARVAGGANPRPRLWMRLRNRFEKKFDFFPQVADVYACTGCGRCVSACPAKIDIRRVLKRLVEHA